MATATENFTVSDLQGLKDNLKAAYDQHIKKGEIEHANRVMGLILKAESAIKKKIQDNAAASDQRPPEDSEPAGQPRGETSIDNISFVSDIGTPIATNSLQLRDHYKFTSKAAFVYYDTLKRQLNQVLRNWVYRKSKEPFNYTSVNDSVSKLLIEIHNAIDLYANEEYKDFIKNEVTYSIGIAGDNRRYCFNLEKLKKDFEF